MQKYSWSQLAFHKIAQSQVGGPQGEKGSSDPQALEPSDQPVGPQQPSDPNVLALQQEINRFRGAHGQQPIPETGIMDEETQAAEEEMDGMQIGVQQDLPEEDQADEEFLEIPQARLQGQRNALRLEPNDPWATPGVI